MLERFKFFNENKLVIMIFSIRDSLSSEKYRRNTLLLLYESENEVMKIGL